MSTLTDEELQHVYMWIDKIPLSRPKRNISRDFSDGVLAAEIVAYYYPKLVDLHSYSAANNTQQKAYNWAHLNDKVFKKFKFNVKQKDVDAIAACSAGVIERVLRDMQVKLAKYKTALEAKARGGGGGSSTGGSSMGRSSNGGGYGSYTGAGGSPGGSAGHVPRYMQPTKAVAQGPPGSTAAPGVSHIPQKPAILHPPEEGTLATQGRTMDELRDTITILESKVKKMEQLLQLKDSKIAALMSKLQAQDASVGMGGGGGGGGPAGRGRNPGARGGRGGRANPMRR